ncbi:unnamed protein product [Chrysoparadoxa australica]
MLCPTTAWRKESRGGESGAAPRGPKVSSSLEADNSHTAAAASPQLQVPVPVSLPVPIQTLASMVKAKPVAERTDKIIGGSWTQEEDERLLELMKVHGKRWAVLAQHMPGRIAKRIRERYVNHLDPNVRKGPWTIAEEERLLMVKAKLGSRWSEIAKEMGGRSQNDVKNHWHLLARRNARAQTQHGSGGGERNVGNGGNSGSSGASVAGGSTGDGGMTAAQREPSRPAAATPMLLVPSTTTSAVRHGQQQHHHQQMQKQQQQHQQQMLQHHQAMDLRAAMAASGALQVPGTHNGGMMGEDGNSRSTASSNASGLKENGHGTQLQYNAAVAPGVTLQPMMMSQQMPGSVRGDHQQHQQHQQMRMVGRSGMPLAPGHSPLGHSPHGHSHGHGHRPGALSLGQQVMAGEAQQMQQAGLLGALLPVAHPHPVQLPGYAQVMQPVQLSPNGGWHPMTNPWGAVNPKGFSTAMSSAAQPSSNHASHTNHATVAAAAAAVDVAPRAAPSPPPTASTVAAAATATSTATAIAVTATAAPEASVAGSGARSPSHVGSDVGSADDMRSHTSGPRWTREQDRELKSHVSIMESNNPSCRDVINDPSTWRYIAQQFPGKSESSCRKRWEKIKEPRITQGRGTWTKEEDEQVLNWVGVYGKRWTTIAQHMQGRLGKQIRDRFLNHLDPERKKTAWTKQEEGVLLAAHAVHNNRWSLIAKWLPGRSDNDVKNHFHTMPKNLTTEMKEMHEASEVLLGFAAQSGAANPDGSIAEPGAAAPGAIPFAGSTPASVDDSAPLPEVEAVMDPAEVTAAASTSSSEN